MAVGEYYEGTSKTLINVAARKASQTVDGNEGMFERAKSRIVAPLEPF
jgi:hypothetical protein